MITRHKSTALWIYNDKLQRKKNIRKFSQFMLYGFGYNILFIMNCCKENNALLSFRDTFFLYIM